MRRGQSLFGVALLLWSCDAIAGDASTEPASLTERGHRVRATFARGAFELTLTCDQPAPPLVLARAPDGVWSLTREKQVLKGSGASGLADQVRAKVEDRTELKACVTGARQDAWSVLPLSMRILAAFDSAVFGERIVLGSLPDAPPDFGGGRPACARCLADADKAYSGCSAQPVLQDEESQRTCGGGVYGAMLDDCHRYCPPPAGERP